jgi:hypothetical protein
LALFRLGFEEPDCALVGSDLLFEVTGVEFGTGLGCQDLVLSTFGGAESGDGSLVSCVCRFTLGDPGARQRAVGIGGARLWRRVDITASAGLGATARLATEIALQPSMVFNHLASELADLVGRGALLGELARGDFKLVALLGGLDE